mmetsp:Transcript_108179/g.187868  ORF Transcript_108179/g.187868 Transcript_108179/m.187868 type:complete len:348 (+) Transcript_108179:32-1075(+)
MSELDAVAVLERKVGDLEGQLNAQAAQHRDELSVLTKAVDDLKRLVAEADEKSQKLDVVGASNSDIFTRRVEWTIDSFGAKDAEMNKGDSMWSPKFKAAGMDGLQLEFFPKGREKTTFEGFCSLFLWCPSGTRLKYQLWVGSFLRAPDEDEYSGRIGHGHSNFCPIAPEVDTVGDRITVGVNFIEVKSESIDVKSKNLQILSTPLEEMVRKEAEIVQNKSVSRVIWKINKVAERMEHLPRGASMWSRVFTAAGIREILLEFYPNGSSNTTKENYCAFYIRCPEGVEMIVTLFVGRERKGPIKTTFDSLTGKGLPDFCNLKDQIAEDGSVKVGIELQSQPSKTLQLES